MQEKIARDKPVPNIIRTERTREALIETARKLFVKNGFAATGTPEIVKLAGVTRGALYHHFADKKAILKAVIGRETAAVGAQIEKSGGHEADALTALKQGASAFMAAMTKRGRTRLILIEGPAVLGQEEIIAIEDQYTRRSLREGLEYALETSAIEGLALNPLLELMSAMFDGAAMKIEAGLAFDEMENVVHRLIDGLARQGG